MNGASAWQESLAATTVDFPSLPSEWTAGQLAEAARFVLSLSDSLIEESQGFRDVSPTRIAFESGKPVLVRPDAIETRDAKDAVWLAFAQFTRVYLHPLLANRLGIPVRALWLAYPNGICAAELTRLAGKRRWLPPYLPFVTLPGLIARSVAPWAGDTSLKLDPAGAKSVLKRHWEGLRRAIEKSYRPISPATEIADPVYCAFIERNLAGRRTMRALVVDAGSTDLPAIAACHSRVVAVDSDERISETLRLKAEGTPISPLCFDFAAPTPASGWNADRASSFSARARGRFDTVILRGTLDRLQRDGIGSRELAFRFAEWGVERVYFDHVTPQDPSVRLLGAESRLHESREAIEAAFFECYVKEDYRIENSGTRALYSWKRRAG